MFINEKNKEINLKVVYFGAPKCGKSTSLQQLCEMIQSEAGGSTMPISLSTGDDQTLYFDFIPVTFGKVKDYTIRLHLYTVPGEVGYDKNRKIIAKGIDGAVFVADSQLGRMEANLASLRELEQVFEEVGTDLASFPLVFQYNKRDVSTAVSFNALREILNRHKRPDFETVATQQEGLSDVLKNIASQVLAQLKRPDIA